MPESGRDKVGMLVGTLAALAIMVGATLAFWHFSRGFLNAANCLGESKREVVGVTNPGAVDASLLGRTVYLSGELRVAQGAEDRELGVKAEVVCLVRRVQYYQWVEEEVRKKPSEAPRYDYHRRWVSRPVDSGKFKTGDFSHRNTVKAKLDAMPSRIPAREVYLGAYRLGDVFKCSLRGDEELRPELVPGGLAGKMSAAGNRFYLGANPQRPEIGDVQVDFFGVAAGPVSLVGVLGEGGVVVPVPDCSVVGRMIWRGEVPPERILGEMAFWHWLLLWGLRLGLFIVYGLACLLLSKVWGWQGRGFGLAAALAVAVIMAAAFL